VDEYDLLRKTELRVENILLQNADLNEMAARIADTLKIDRKYILVTDVQKTTLTFDILRETVNANDILGKKVELLESLATVPGVSISDKTVFSSDGMLSWIAHNGKRARSALRHSKRISKDILQRLSKRAIVFSSGLEVASGQVKDTNTPNIRDRLKAEGYSVTVGPTLKDD
jgi:hypothetical protein